MSGGEAPRTLFGTKFVVASTTASTLSYLEPMEAVTHGTGNLIQCTTVRQMPVLILMHNHNR